MTVDHTTRKRMERDYRGVCTLTFSFFKDFFTSDCSDLSVFKLLSYNFVEAYACTFTHTNNTGDK